jgi:glycosyltransferase involved in cell wall biosynthesis
MIDNEKNDDFCPTVLNTIPPGKEGPASPCKIEVHDRPLITFALIAYNQERFIREAVNGAFSQTYSPLEIILSDDCSTDNTYDIMAEMARNYNGPHKIILNRNPVNRGIGAHINRVMEISKGELIVGAAGDDVSLPDRVQEIYKAYLASHGLAMSLHSAVIFIDEEGKELGIAQNYPEGYKITIDQTLKVGTKAWGCSHAWHRKVFEKFGPLSEDVVLEDEAISFRSLLIGKIVHVNRPLVLYRLHGGNISGERNMVKKGIRRFSSPDQLYRWRLKKFKEEITVNRQYYIDLEKIKDNFDKEEIEKIKKRVRERIRVIELELKVRLTGANLRHIDYILRAGWNPLRVAKLALLVLYPQLFARLSFFKWQFVCVYKKLLTSWGAMISFEKFQPKS